MPDHASNHPSELERVAAPSWPALDVQCAMCHGARGVRCCRCAGHGRIPTEFGKAVLDFVGSRLRVTAEARC